MIKSRSQKRLVRKRRSNLIKGTKSRLRVVISKTNLYLIAQAINDEQGHTELYLSTANLGEKSKSVKPISLKNKDCAGKLGEKMAEKLNKLGMKNIIFDRNGYPYHGKIASFCQNLRQKGINF